MDCFVIAPSVTVREFDLVTVEVAVGSPFLSFHSPLATLQNRVGLGVENDLLEVEVLGRGE